MDEEQRYGPDPGGSDRPRIAGEAGSLLVLINGVFASVGGVYLMTRSIMITAIAGCVALVLARLVVVKR